MRAISLWQPWSALMAVGAKHNETRPLGFSAYNYKGLLVICAAKHWNVACSLTLYTDEVQRALLPYYGNSHGGLVQKSDLEFGHALAAVTMFDWQMSDVVAGLSRYELRFGNYSPGRRVLLTRNAHRLTSPVPVLGRQGIWELTTDEAREVELHL